MLRVVAQKKSQLKVVTDITLVQRYSHGVTDIKCDFNNYVFCIHSLNI